jgi:hypothetical protein
MRVSWLPFLTIFARFANVMLIPPTCCVGYVGSFADTSPGENLRYSTFALGIAAAGLMNLIALSLAGNACPSCITVALTLDVIVVARFALFWWTSTLGPVADTALPIAILGGSSAFILICSDLRFRIRDFMIAIGIAGVASAILTTV